MPAEQGRGFRENLASNQNQFNQNLGSNQFNAGESARNFGERFAGESQYFNQQQARDQFAAQQRQQQFGNQMANQNLARPERPFPSPTAIQSVQRRPASARTLERRK